MIINLQAADEISGTLGHDIADAYLQEAARQLGHMIDSTHVLARVKADTFMILLSNTGATDARRLAEGLVARLKPGIQLPDVRIAANPIIGIAVYPDHAVDREHLLMRATIAIEAKDELRRPVRFYRTGEEEQRVRNMTLLQDLRRAVDENELQLHYQPKIVIDDESICGAEALVRWQHPDYGWLTPDKFVPIVEKSGNIAMLTHWVIETAARQYQQWRKAGLDLSIAINFSAHDIQDQNLPWQIMDALRLSEMPANKLIAEITEEAMVLDFGDARTVLRHLRDLGIRISIDDFGTGYSSLSQLKNLPVNELKIDRSFIAQLPDDHSDAAIVSASVELAKKLGLDVVAEGVANSAIMDWLRQHGIEYGQGFYWSAPLSGSDFEAWAADFKGGSTRHVRTLNFKGQ
jgi:EAL domain-containing protein (putative c-di-GMP-specific phosphodiesterase class I)/GGDEF domain-containing protein